MVDEAAARATTRAMVESLRDDLLNQASKSLERADALASKELAPASVAERYGDALRRIAELVGMDTRDPSFDPLDAEDGVRIALESKGR